MTSVQMHRFTGFANRPSDLTSPPPSARRNHIHPPPHTLICVAYVLTAARETPTWNPRPPTWVQIDGRRWRDHQMETVNQLSLGESLKIPSSVSLITGNLLQMTFRNQTGAFFLSHLFSIFSSVYPAPNIFSFKTRTLSVIQLCWKFPNVLFYLVWVGGAGSAVPFMNQNGINSYWRSSRASFWETSPAGETNTGFKQI